MEYEKALVKLAEQVKNWADSKFTAIEQENLELKSKLAELENTLEVQEANKANLPSPPSLEETITTLKSDERFMEYLKVTKVSLEKEARMVSQYLLKKY